MLIFKRKGKSILAIFGIITFITLLLFPALAGEEEAAEVTIKFMHEYWRDPELEVLRKQLEEFESQNPNIHLEVTQVPWSDAYREITTALAGGVMPDVLELGMTWHGEFMDIGALEPLNDYITPEMKSDIFNSSWEFWTVDGKIAGVPTEAQPWGLSYRRDIFKEAGLDPDKPPKTWDELVKYAKKLKEHTGGWGVGIYAIQPKVQWCWIPVMISADCPLLAKEGGKWKSVINTPNGLSGMHAFIDLVTVHKVMPVDVVGEGFTECIEGFKQGKYPIITPIGLFIEPNLTPWDPSQAKWAFAELPVINRKGTLASHTAYAISSSCEHKKEAWKLIEFLASSENIIEISIAGNLNPPRRSAMDHPFFQKPYLAARLKSSEFALGMPKHKAFTEIMDKVYAPIVQEAMLGKISVEEAAKQMDREANKVLAKY